jgi:Zn-dependent membrane protease YugP
MSLGLWVVLIIIPVFLGMYAQMRVSSAYSKNLQIPTRRRITGAQAAEAVIRSAGITNVSIVEIPGQLSDHYDPSKKQLALSSDNYRGTSLAAVGVAAHEAGHAIQDKTGYAMMTFRQNLVPAMRFAAPVAYFLMTFGMFFMGQNGGVLLQLGVAALAVMTLFQLVTLPVEYDASRRAKTQLVQLGVVDRDEMPGVNETLNAAALTYLAAFVSSLGTLLYLLSILSGGRRSD